VVRCCFCDGVFLVLLFLKVFFGDGVLFSRCFCGELVFFGGGVFVSLFFVCVFVCWCICVVGFCFVFLCAGVFVSLFFVSSLTERLPLESY